MGQPRTRGHGCCTATTAFCLEFNHMRQVHLLIVVGVGTLGPPDRVFPLPPASVKPFFITRHGKEKAAYKHFLCCDQLSPLQKESWMEMDE